MPERKRDLRSTRVWQSWSHEQGWGGHRAGSTSHRPRGCLVLERREPGCVSTRSVGLRGQGAFTWVWSAPSTRRPAQQSARGLAKATKGREGTRDKGKRDGSEKGPSEPRAAALSWLPLDRRAALLSVPRVCPALC